MSRLILTSFVALLLLLYSLPLGIAAAADPDSIDDRPLPLVPAQPRTEAQRDSLEAAALLATARTMQQREHADTALRLYERAIRLDPNAVAALREIVPLAEDQHLPAEAHRYEIMLAGQEDSQPVAIQAGVFLAEQGKLTQAAALLEKGLRLEPATPLPFPVQAQLYLELIRIYLLDQQYADAARHFDKLSPMLDKPKDFGLEEQVVKTLVGEKGATYALMGATYLEVGRPADAAAAFQKCNHEFPDAAQLALNMARVAAKESHPDEALAKLQTYFDSRPAELEMSPLALLAELLKDGNQSDQLIPRLEKLRQTMPDSVALDYFLAEKYREAGKPTEARPLYEAVLKKGTAAGAYRALAAIYRTDGSHEALLRLLGEAAEADKNQSLDLLEKEGKTLAADDKLAAALFQLARTRHAVAAEDDFLPLRGAAALASQRKQYDIAGEFYNLACRAAPKQQVDLLLLWGLDLLVAEKYDEAAKVLQRGVDAGGLPSSPAAFEYYLAEALELAGKTDAALEVARRMATNHRPLETRFAARQPWILYHAKRYDDAYRAYKGLLAVRNSDMTDANREGLRDLRSGLSNVCVAQNKPAEAEEWLEQILDEFPDDPGAMNDLGYLWADENKHPQRALAMVRRAVDAERDNASYRDSLGWALFRVGRFDEALVELKKAIATGAADQPEVLDHLGEVHAALKDPTNARDAWTRAKTGYEKDHDAEKARLVQAKLDKLK